MSNRKVKARTTIMTDLRDSLEQQLLREREDGDGASECHTPPSEVEQQDSLVTSSDADADKIPRNKTVKTEMSFTEFSFKLDLIGILLFVLSAATRFYNLNYPQQIVFDELQYGKHASLYLRRVFFFDPQPPLGKQLIAASAALFDPSYNGTFKFERIGAAYPNWVPVFGLRFVPALTGSLVPVAAYSLVRQLGIPHQFALLAGLLLIFDNAMLIQSRHVLMEMPMILFGLLSILFAVKFTKDKRCRHLQLVALSAFFCTLSLSVKYIGCFYLILSSGIILHHLWTNVVPRKDFSTSRVLRSIFSAGIVFGTTAFLAYVSIFYVHLSVLTNAGPHDSVMTSAFQASLNGGLASIVKGQPLQIAHGSQVTLRHTLGRPCWLHSHAHNYPLKYDDGRGSSHQQQVTCYSFKDVNNWWIVKRPNVDTLGVNDTMDVVRNGDEVHLVHGMSGRLLNSHDVAAPQTPQNQEVSCYIDFNVSMPAQPLWRVDIVAGCKGGSEPCAWEAVRSTVRLVHVSTGQALRMSGKQLPKWGFNQHEVVTDRVVVQDDTIWNVEEHRYTKSEKDREKELLEAEMIPTERTIVSFWSKFLELQWKMLVSTGSGADGESHAYASTPSDWPLLSRGIAYWVDRGNNGQIHLLGNPVTWISSTLFLLLTVVILTLHLLARRRETKLISDEEWSLLRFQCVILGGGYLLTFVYHFCLDRTLFLHHYLPSYVFKVLLSVVLLRHLGNVAERKGFHMLYVTILSIWIAGLLWAFTQLTPLTYGQPALTKSELDNLRWRSNWDFIIQTNE